MHLSMLKKLVLCALASMIIFWGISTVKNFMFRSNSMKENVSHNTDMTIIDSKKSNKTIRKNGIRLSGKLELLASANIKSGQMVFRKCKSCHTTQIGGKNKIGPNLWEIVGRSKASMDNYRFSKALKRIGGNWNYQDLDDFLTNPKKFAKGTKMSFSGIKSAQTRANLIIFLRSLSEHPKPLP
jgi:cytochrome c2